MRSNQSRGTKADKEPAVEATSAGGDPIRRHLMYISSRSTCSGREWKRQEEGKHCVTGTARLPVELPYSNILAVHRLAGPPQNLLYRTNEQACDYHGAWWGWWGRLAAKPCAKRIKCALNPLYRWNRNSITSFSRLSRVHSPRAKSRSFSYQPCPPWALPGIPPFRVTGKGPYITATAFLTLIRECVCPP